MSGINERTCDQCGTVRRDQRDPQTGWVPAIYTYDHWLSVTGQRVGRLDFCRSDCAAEYLSSWRDDNASR